MTTTELTRYDIDVSDVEYIRHGNKPLLARVYKHRGLIALVDTPAARHTSCSKEANDAVGHFLR